MVTCKFKSLVSLLISLSHNYIKSIIPKMAMNRYLDIIYNYNKQTIIDLKVESCPSYQVYHTIVNNPDSYLESSTL